MRILGTITIVLAVASCSPPGTSKQASTPPQEARVSGMAVPALELANLHRPGPGVYTAGRLQPEDVARLRAAGVRHVIDLTQDSETPGFDEASTVRAAGMAYDNLPIAGPQDLTRDNVRAFDRLVSGSLQPLLVHCASSNRVGAMAALRAAWIDGKPVDEAIAEGRAWGLTSLEPAVRERLAAGAR
jgi:uncharacterized protein (TIGR01244 family)